MKTSLCIAAIFCALLGSSQVANAKGCIKGAAVGGVGGHIAGGHGVLGAAAGCVVGRHVANKKDKEQAQATSTPAAVPAPAK